MIDNKIVREAIDVLIGSTGIAVSLGLFTYLAGFP